MRNDAVFVKTTPQGLLAPACAAPFQRDGSRQLSRSATTPATMHKAEAARQPVIFSPSAKTEIAMAKRMEVSRSDATEAIGAFVIAHMAIA
jgi:hypothetical protein